MILERCRLLAGFSETPGRITRTYLSRPMHDVHRVLGGWLEDAGCQVRVDAAGNIRGFYAARRADAPRLVIGSHLDTVPDAGAFDGVLGVVIGVALLEQLGRRRLPYAIEVIGFAEEEGVRYGVPFIGSRAVTGTLDAALMARIAPAIRDFGLDPAALPAAVLPPDVIGYMEFHIEQGPVLESLDRPLAVVEAIAGQSRLRLEFQGSANHAGTTPMHLRRDALAAAAEWIGHVETQARGIGGLVATVGSVEVRPGAGNVIPGHAATSLDVRHGSDTVRSQAVAALLAAAQDCGARRGVGVEARVLLDQPAVPMDPELTERLAMAATVKGALPHRMLSGAGHDAMILAGRFPAAMLFLRSPGGISHHPDESVLPEDVEVAVEAGGRFLQALEAEYAGYR